VLKIKGTWFVHYFNFNSHHRPDVLSVYVHFQNLLPTEGLIYKSVTSAVAGNSKVLTITDAISDDCKRFSGL
jgi:hypothetical protein